MSNKVRILFLAANPQDSSKLRLDEDIREIHAKIIYYDEDHDNLRGKIDVLQNHGYLVEVTPGNTPICRMSEEFVKFVLADG
jgi:hypothetical protein